MAALWVVVFHFREHFPDGTILPGLADRGYLAVDMFFVLSGFVLAFVYRQQIVGGTFVYRRFLLKRLARLYPVHIVTLLAVYALVVMGSLTGVKDADIALSTLAIVPSALGVEAWGAPLSMMLNFPSWSISAEFFVYLWFPVLFALCRKARRPLGVGLVALFCAPS